MTKFKKTVFVGVSGGVDSSVSAAILKDQGYNVVGVFIRTWSPDFIKCTWRDERRDAMRVCAHLGIPFLECDAEKEYKKGVADYMIEEYKNGRTPNPDVMCNREVKFGVFWNFAKKHGADYIATGHYAICSDNKAITKHSFLNGLMPTSASLVREPEKKNISFWLKKSPDKSKDQSYFLWTLTQDDLSHILFPVGHLEKKDVRKIALRYKIPVAKKKDSQGVCFLGPLDMKEFLGHYIKQKKGKVLNIEGKEIGYHNGAVFFTLGERHGFSITEKTEKDKPYYVVSKDIKNNTITVSSSKSFFSSGPRMREDEEPDHSEKELFDYEINIEKTNWILDIPKENYKYTAQIRYHGEYFYCKIRILEGKKAEIVFNKNILVDVGQSIVVYDDNICLGGGIVQSLV